MAMQECFSDKYRTRDGVEVFIFHFQRLEGDEWFYSYARAKGTYLPDDATVTVADARFHASSLNDLRKQAADFAETLHLSDKSTLSSKSLTSSSLGG